MKYDIAVIGGGPAGLMAAGRAAERGLKVVVLEKNRDLAKKLLITGGGRCNVTNAEFDVRELISQYGDNGKFLFSALNNFGVADTMEFFEDRDVSLKIEDNNRVFPVSDKSLDIRKAVYGYTKEGGVEIINSPVTEITSKDNRIISAKTDGQVVEADSFIITTGGVTYSATGSTGDAFPWLANLGHAIVEPKPALSSIVSDDAWVKELQGLSLQDIGITIYQNNKQQLSTRGDIMFTHDGLSGPSILNISKAVGELLEEGEVEIGLDIAPDTEFADFDKELQERWKGKPNRALRNHLSLLFPSRMAKMLMWLTNIESEVAVHSVFKEERRSIVHLVKDNRIKVKSLCELDKAKVTRGGVSLKEIDPKTMKSKIIENLYFAGEVMDLDGPTGGYNLQVAWTTGYVAGDSVE